MIENVARKVTFVALALLASLALLVIPDKPFQLGLDLQGGTRLTYAFDMSKVPLPAGQATSTQGANDLSPVVQIVRNRVDPTGVLEATIRQEGTENIVIELPGSPVLSGTKATSSLAAELSALEKVSIQLASDGAAGFPEGGGTVDIDDEKIHYEKREGSTLHKLDRGHRATVPAAHAAGAVVTLSSDDAIKDLIENLGDLSVNIFANASDFTGTDTDFAAEEAKLKTWVDANPGLPLVAFNALKPEEGGPHARLKWVTRKPADENDALTSEYDRRVPLLIQEDPDLRFYGSDLAQVYPARDPSGFPAVGFEMQPGRKNSFGQLTEDYIDRAMVISLNDRAESIANINDKLPGQGIIMGRFSNQEVLDLVTVIQSGSLPIKPTLVNEEVVGPTLGQQYVRRALYAALLAIGAVMALMIAYYRRLGVLAAVALTANLFMLLGGLAFLRATVTLPGIAGIILTVGMAVDANILIFDRIREEQDRGQNVKQAAKAGFERAFSAIFDSNLVTLITALILYKVGTGPVRGFAVTLCMGIITSMIAALVITRLLIHWSLLRNPKPFEMGRWMVNANYRFLSKTKIAVTCSVIMMVASIVGFAVRSEDDKLGVDFLGGGEVLITTEEPQEVEDVRTLVAGIPGAIGPSSEVKPIFSSKVGDKFTSFRISFKVSTEQREAGAEQSLKAEIQKNLGSILQKGPIEVGDATQSAGLDVWNVKLYFTDEHPVTDVGERLVEQGFQSPSFTAAPDRPEIISGTVTSTALGKPEVENLISTAFSRGADSHGTEFVLSQPIPSSTLVGPQVVGELRNKAIIALVVSLFATVIYLRVRFAEYSYGIAAVAAVVHDVIFALGALTLGDVLGIVNGELSLPMVAAFLTIIGYSLNDTIVIFDRVRENLPRMKKPLSEVLEISINETLSRTFLTTSTVFLAVLILYGFFIGTGSTLEGFCFAMLTGMISGTYSTIFIANPILLWLETRAAKHGRGARAHLDAEREARQRTREDDKAMTST
jgi:SecD/SecF fusion protein